ncbi:hypothetical protein [Chryseobacterium sp. R2A-55]|uniref:hypothetical protein n=1 Tax=Chryseobacterium sp. R2A-55 TaxID=2744445 RepID=UPI001F2E9F1C|nr:hypothetical protein [Chryseobacterium sp. R2A-55]
MNNIEIKKAKIKNGIFLAYEYLEKTDNYENKISTSSDAPIHDDLRESFKALVPHFALLTEETTKKTFDSCIKSGKIHDSLGKFEVTGFTIGGNGDTEGVVISGHKVLESGNKVNFSTPFQMFDDSENYDYATELLEAVEQLKNEVYEYMEGKQAPKMVVGTLDFGEEDEEAFQMVDDLEDFGSDE